MERSKNRRILVIDDNKQIHEDFHHIFGSSEKKIQNEKLRTDLLNFFNEPGVDTPEPKENQLHFEIHSAYQGADGLELVKTSLINQQPFALAFVDMRMPPGWDGVETIQKIWAIDPNIHIVICTAFSNYSWDEVFQKISRNKLIILKKPFEPVEAFQLAATMTEKWNQMIDIEKEKEISERANRAKSLFLANISHEIRTPMHGILSFARFGIKKSDDANREKLKSYFTEIFDSGNRLLTLLNNLLDLSKLESGKMTYEKRTTNITNLIDEAISSHTAVGEEKGVKIVHHKQTQSIDGYFDAIRITQVLRNLISNAIKFSDPESKIDIISEVTTDKDRIDRICIRVINTGTPIPPEEREAIFEKFIQSTSTNSGAGGTGLGLPICNEIIRAHHGKITAGETPDNRTEFRLEMIREGNKKIVLIAEQDQITQDVIVSLLDEDRFFIQLVNSGIEAYDRISEYTYDYIFADYKVSELNGRRLSRKLEKLGFDTKLILITDSASIQDLPEEYRDRPNILFLQKPIDKEAFEVAISNNLKMIA